MLTLYAGALLTYACTWAFTWDESYHLLAAQLINAGREPYIDFCFPQAPLNAYWNAALMREFGPGWRVPHAFAALLVVAAVWLIADYVFRRFPVPHWRFAAAATAGLAAGLNPMVFLYGPIAQPYALSVVALVVAFRTSVRAVDRDGLRFAALAGLAAGIAAASSLLTAAAVPVFVVWMLVCNRHGRRGAKATVYCVAAAVPFLPVFRLFALGPRQTWFNLVEYHLHYRKLYWSETTSHDLEVLTSWINSGPALILGILALTGLLYVARASGWSRSEKAPFYLCAWLAVALAAEVGSAHPAFPQYFLLIVPFLAIPGAAGLYSIASQTQRLNAAPLWPALLVGMLFLLGLSRALYDDRDSTDWRDYRKIADKLDQVTPPGASLFADEPIYFLTRRIPPAGFELYYTHKLNLPPAEAALLHIIDSAEVRRQVQARLFPVAYSCDDAEIEYYGLKSLYRRQTDIADCTVFQDLAPRAPEGK